MTITTTESTSPLIAEMEYARTVASASMLPDHYRNKPADVMIAVGLGSAMGLSPAESLYRIAVIKGKPTASAELIASNVRKAGHRLRTIIADDGQSATSSIWRVDDPEFEHRVTRDLAWAQKMGLAKNDNYVKQLGTMLANRSITAAARLACPEALYGVAYSSDEMGDFPEQRTAAAPSSQADRLRSALRPEPEPTVTVEQVEAEPLLLDTKSPLAKAMYASMREAGIEGERAHEFFSEVTGREITSSKELTEDEARKVLDHLPQQDTPDA